MVDTVRVKAWVALGVIPLAAVMVIGKVPLVRRGAREQPAVDRVTPVGSVPVSVKVGAGKPEAVTVKVPAVPSVKVVSAAEVITGAASTVRVKAWVAGVPTPLLAVRVIGKVPLAVGVPESTPAVDRVTPVGSVPVSVKVGAGNAGGGHREGAGRAFGEGGGCH